MRYVLVKENEIIDGPKLLPINWGNISNFDVLDNETLRQYGWLPYTFQSVELSHGEMYDGTDLVISEHEVIEYQKKRPKTDGEIAVDNANLWENIRSRRDNELKESDWTQLPDSPLSTDKKSEWQTYRQGLRDVTSYPNPNEIPWPQKPE